MDIKDSIFVEDNEEFTWDENALEAFKKMISDQGIKCCMDDIFLLGFLRARKFDLQRSFKLLNNYYNIRSNYPKYFKDLYPSNLEHGLSMNSIQFLPQPDQKGRYIVIWQIKNWDISVCNITDMFRVMLLLGDLQLSLHRTQVNGIVGIVDAEGFSFSQFLQFTPTVLNSIVSIIFRDSYQLRYKEIHYVNLNAIVKAILNIFIPLLPNKLKQRLHFHSDIASLHEFINRERLPSEYGGTLPSFDPTQSNNMIKANEEFFRKNEEYLNLYKEELNKNVTHGKYHCTSKEKNEKLKTFIEKSEENCIHYKDPERFLHSSQ